MTSRTLALGRPPGGAGTARFRGEGNSLWVLSAAILSIAAGILTGAAPLVLVGAVGVGVATSAFLAVPAMALLGILAVRSIVDHNELLPFAGSGFTGKINTAVAVGGGLALLLTSKRVPAPAVTVPYLLLLGLALLTLPFSEGVSKGGAWMALAAMLVIFVLSARVVKDAQGLQRLVWVVLASAIIPVGVGLSQVVTGDTFVRDGGYAAVHGTFGNLNGFAFYLLVVIVLAIVTLLQSQSAALRAALVVGIVLASLCFFLTYTRSAWGVAVLVLILLALLQYRSLMLAGAIGVAVAVLAFPSVLTTVEGRFSNLSSESQSSDTSSWSWRLDNWTRMFPYATDNPLFGHGIASYPALTFQEFGTSARNFAHIDGAAEGVFAHNDYLSLAVELGVSGLFLWAMVLVGLALLMWRARAITEIRAYATAAFVLAVAIIVLSGVDNMQSYTGVMYYVLALCGAVAGVAARAGTTTPRPRPSVT